MPPADQQARLDEAFERIEETILPCIAMMLETLIDASESVAEGERRFAQGRPGGRCRRASLDYPRPVNPAEVLRWPPRRAGSSSKR